jgi:hypothetical protein
MTGDLILSLGDKNLQKYSHSFIQALFIPQSSKEFLEHIGLPIIVDPRFKFRPETFTFTRVDGDENFRRIGVYDSTSICLKDGEGEVYWYDNNGCALFMNSSVEAFAIFVTLYYQMLGKARVVVEIAEKRALVGAAEQQMRSIDARAFCDSEFYWPMIFEEMGYELD